MRARLLLAWTSLAALSLSVVGPSGANAQAWLADRERSEGIGIRAGNLEIHPGIGSEIGYDSNVFNADKQPQGSAILRLSPHLLLSTLGPARRENSGSNGEQPAVEFRGGASVPIYVYFSTPQKTRWEANLDLDLQLLPSRPVSFGVAGKYTRTARPFTDGPADLNYGRNVVEVFPQINFQTTGGVLKTSVGGGLTYGFFDASKLTLYNYLSYALKVNSSWEFLPKTALVYDADLSWRDYQDPSSESGGSMRNNGARYQFRAGFNGALTARVSVTAMAGYAAAFFDAGSDTDELLAMLQLRWKPSEATQLSLGYDRSLTAAFQGNYHRSDRFSAKAQVLMGGAFLLAADVAYALVQYGFDPLTNANEARLDPRINAGVNGEYRFTDWFALTASASVIANMTKFDNQVDVAVIDPAKFTKFDAFLGARIYY